MHRLLLIDGHNLLFKAFFGMPERIKADGQSVHGVVGFISILVKVIRRTTPTHVLVVFDPEETPSRTENFPDYKANRKDYNLGPERENPFTQLEGIKKGLDAIGVKFCEHSGHEADDLIASYAVNPEYQAVIVSTDNDFLQLVNETTGVYHYHGANSIWYNTAEFVKKYEFHPSRYLEYKALVGDKSDNISGVRGIGPKTAVKVLKKERALTLEEQTIFERNIDLIRLNSKVDLPYSLEQLVYQNHLDMFGVGAILRNAGII